MAWHTHLQLSTSSQEQEEEFSLTSYLDTIQSERVKLNPTHVTSCSSDNSTDTSQDSLCGTMWLPSTEILGEEQLTFFVEDFPAKTSQQQTQRAKELREVGQDFGRSIQGLLMRSNLQLSLPKTARCFGPEDLEPSSRTLPSWGIMHDGELWELGTSLHPTEETACGYWPAVTTDPSMRSTKYKQGGTPLSYAVQQKQWITPTAYDAKGTQKWREEFQNGLVAQVANPTQWPTPRASDYKGGEAPRSLTRKDGKSRMDKIPNVVAYGGLTTQQISELDQTSYHRTLRINPSWTEWLMGWPIGWTDSRPLETAKFRNVQHWHSEFCRTDFCQYD